MAAEGGAGEAIEPKPQRQSSSMNYDVIYTQSLYALNTLI